jgi:hypothetical protein
MSPTPTIIPITQMPRFRYVKHFLFLFTLCSLSIFNVLAILFSSQEEKRYRIDIEGDNEM